MERSPVLTNHRMSCACSKYLGKMFADMVLEHNSLVAFIIFRSVIALRFFQDTTSHACAATHESTGYIQRHRFLPNVSTERGDRILHGVPFRPPQRRRLPSCFIWTKSELVGRWVLFVTRHPTGALGEQT